MSRRIENLKLLILLRVSCYERERKKEEREIELKILC